MSRRGPRQDPAPDPPPALAPDPFPDWFDALEQRALADLRFPEVRRALQALSSIYVERRERLARKAPLDGAGKRAAFALFYGPIHFLTVRAIARALEPSLESARRHERVLDLGCGTGVAGAAWALEEKLRYGAPGPRVTGIDESGWAVAEASFTYARLGVAGRAERGSLERVSLPGAGALVIAAWTVNEVEPAGHAALLARLLEAAARGADVLVVEPLARGVATYWDDWSAEFLKRGGRADEWRFPVTLPYQLRLLDKAAGLDHRTLGARSLWVAGFVDTDESTNRTSRSAAETRSGHTSVDLVR